MSEKVEEIQHIEKLGKILNELHSQVKIQFQLKEEDNIIFNQVKEEELTHELIQKIYDWNLFDSEIVEKQMSQSKTIVLTSKQFSYLQPSYQLICIEENIYKIIPYQFNYMEITILSI